MRLTKNGGFLYDKTVCAIGKMQS